MNYRELTNEQRRQYLDVIQVDAEYRATQREWKHSFSGSMRWLRRKGKDYLHIKKGTVEKSSGLRSAATEKIYSSFQSQRALLKKRITALRAQLDSMAPVNRAMGLGRVPKLSAQVFRKMDEEELLGSHFIIAGTNALWAYETKAGLQFIADVVATRDADLIWDPRQKIELLPANVAKKGLLKLLQEVDQSFTKRGQHDYLAINKFGFAVEVIRPEDRLFFNDQSKRNQLTNVKDDMKAAAIFGLQWLVNSPRFEAVAIAEDGYTIRLVTFDPRAFVLHKLWLSTRPDRDPIKAKRDVAQALLVKEITMTYLNLDFTKEDLRALPKKMRDIF